MLVTDCKQALYVTKESSVTITDSNFSNLGSITQIKGGAIDCINSNITVRSSSFTNNTAHDGAAINLE